MKVGTKRAISFAAIIIGFFMALLDTTIVNIALPEMTKYFNSDMQSISWVMNGYNLAFAVFLITASRLADQFGRKKLFIIGISLFTVSSFMAGVSSTVGMLIFFRVAQGLAAAIVVPVTIPLAMELFPVEKHGMVMGIWGAISGLAAASGPALGGILTQSFKWHSIFFVNVPIGIIAVILAAVYLKESYDPTATKRIDWAGMISISISMFAVTYGLIKVTDYGWTSATTLAMFGIFVIALAAFILIELKSKEPMLPMWLLKILPFDAASMTLFIFGAGIMAATFIMSYFLTQILGLTTLQAGLTISAMPLTSMVSSAIVGPITTKRGSRFFVTLGMAILSISIFLLSGLSAESTRMDAVWRLLIAGLGLGMTMAPVMGSVVRNVPQEKVGVASGVTNMTRALGAVLGVAVLITVLNSGVTTQVNKAKDNVSTIVQKDTVLMPQVKEAFLGKIKDIKISQENHDINVNLAVQPLEQMEKQTLEKTPSAGRDKVKAMFDAQIGEVKKLWPKIEGTFKDNLANAFDSTFKFGGFMIIIGILFAVFSDKKKEKEGGPADVVYES
ncbi:MAG: MFS transporter [Bacillota bacterium]|nr:MFS transporter [Bacillota bacterium]